jgi:predicted permease
MGLPLSVAFFGPAAAVPAALVFCFDCTIQFILTPTVATMGHARNEEARWGDVAARVAKQVATHPFIIATVLGAFASFLEWRPPGGIETILEMLMKSAGPCALFALGATVGMRRFSGIGPDLPWIAAIKLILQPVLAAMALSLVPGLDPMWFHVALMMAALPTASNAFILARQYGSYIEGASSAVIVTTVLSAITIPLLIYAIRLGWL